MRKQIATPAMEGKEEDRVRGEEGGGGEFEEYLNKRRKRKRT
jgi:hypothetical protein